MENNYVTLDVNGSPIALFCVECVNFYGKKDVIAKFIIGGESVCEKHLEQIMGAKFTPPLEQI